VGSGHIVTMSASRMLTESFVTLMNASSDRSIYRSAKVIKETKTRHNSPVNRQTRSQGFLVNMLKDSSEFCYNTAADWLERVTQEDS